MELIKIIFKVLIAFMIVFATGISFMWIVFGDLPIKYLLAIAWMFLMAYALKKERG